MIFICGSMPGIRRDKDHITTTALKRFCELFFYLHKIIKNLS